MVKSFFNDLFVSFKSWITGKWSNFNYVIAKNEANRLCKQYNRKYFVIQSSNVHWKVFSTSDILVLKKKRIFKKDLSFKEMSEKSAYIAFPNKKTVTTKI